MATDSISNSWTMTILTLGRILLSKIGNFERHSSLSIIITSLISKMQFTLQQVEENKE